jgi:hypothetical protein
MPNPSTPFGRATPETALRLFLRPSSTPLDNPRRTPKNGVDGAAAADGAGGADGADGAVPSSRQELSKLPSVLVYYGLKCLHFPNILNY